MRTFKSRFAFLFFLGAAVGLTNAATLPFQTVFKGREKFDYLVQQAQANNWKSLPIGDRTAAVGRALVGTRYKSFTLEIDDQVEAPSANFFGMDCWTFFEIALGFARMLDQPQAEWTPATLLHYVELDRYRGGHCTGEYLSRLHYLEDWLADNDRRGLVEDLTRELGGVRANHAAQEMTFGWRHYRYLKANPSLARAVRPNGSQSQRATTLPDSQEPGRPHRAGAEERRHYWDHRARSARALLDFARRPRLSDKRRRAPFHARLLPAKLRESGRRLATLQLPRALSQRQRNPRRAPAALVVVIRQLFHEFRKPLHGFVRISAVRFQGGDRTAVEVRTHHINQAER